jgi:hypothetical protein
VGSPWGPFLGPAQVRQAVKATLDKWATTYVHEAIRQVGTLDPPLQAFEDWINEPGITAMNPGMSPRYIVAVPGTSGIPRRAGNGSYRGSWVVTVTLWLYGTDYQTTEDYLGYYLTALREALVQNGTLGGVAESTEWESDRYAPAGAPTAFHSWGVATLNFVVTIDGMLNAFTGPIAVPADPTAAPVANPAYTSSTITIQEVNVGGTL